MRNARVRADPPASAPTSSSSGSLGITSMRSVTRISVASNQPRNQPARIPTMPPTSTVPAPATSATSSELRVPRISWLATSCPSRLVPRRCSRLGASSEEPASSVARNVAS